MGKEYHVSLQGCDRSKGTFKEPFRTISRAAEIAEAGDRVIVHEGTYREWVKPEHAGNSDSDRIVYEAAAGEKVIIKGSEIIGNWEKVENTVWKAYIPNTIFGHYNPYEEKIEGDWIVAPKKYSVHAGDIYLNGKSFYEAVSVEEVKMARPRVVCNDVAHPDIPERLLYPEDSIYQWYAEVEKEYTILYANFHGFNPNNECVEINVRKCCFYPEKEGVNYITVRGFEMAQAACPWAPPTAEQPALLGTHWSKGWIIENNIIHDAKCSAISIGRDETFGNNQSFRERRKSGHQYQLETIFKALKEGWNEEKVGSHIIRDNVIYNCGQNGIVGSLGCIFSKIYHNHIFNIAIKHEFFGHEIGGIKLHTAIDTQICHNNIHHCTLGLWLDWESQGTRVSSNLFYENNRDMMIEVTHGPCLIDNNIFASKYNFDNMAQGTAYVHNLCCGSMLKRSVMDRATPYHFPHSTQIAGYAFVYGGDDRWYQNIFTGNGLQETKKLTMGTSSYNDSPESMEEYRSKMQDSKDKYFDEYEKLIQPVYISGNAYFGGAQPYLKEHQKLVDTKKMEVEIIKEGDNVFLEMFVNSEIMKIGSSIIDTEKLGTIRIVEELFEQPDGKCIRIDTDYLGERRGEQPTPGPFEQMVEGANRFKIW